MLSYCILTWQNRDWKQALVSLFVRALTLFERALTSWPKYLPKAPPPTTTMWEVRNSMCEFAGETHVVHSTGSDDSKGGVKHY